MSARDQRRQLPSGLWVYGATSFEARTQNFIDDYFRSGLELAPGMVVLDIGANIGMFSLELLRRCPGARVLAFEPAPETFGYLERNVRALFPDADARLRLCAVGETTGQATLYHRPRVPVFSSLMQDPQGDPKTFIDGLLKDPPPEFQRRFGMRIRRLIPRPLISKLLTVIGQRMGMDEVVEIPCEVVTVSQILRESGIDHVDLLKVDVEGAELDVLRGIDADDWAKLGTIACEVDDIGGRLQGIREILGAHGFDRIDVTQDWPFEDTDVYMLHASRSADAGEAAEQATASSPDAG